jgi:hypothetical protein
MNTAAEVGGGIVVFNSGPLSLWKSVVTGNTAVVSGGGIDAYLFSDNVSLNGSAVVGNSPDDCHDLRFDVVVPCS